MWIAHMQMRSPEITWLYLVNNQADTLFNHCSASALGFKWQQVQALTVWISLNEGSKSANREKICRHERACWYHDMNSPWTAESTHPSPWNPSSNRLDLLETRRLLARLHGLKLGIANAKGDEDLGHSRQRNMTNSKGTPAFSPLPSWFVHSSVTRTELGCPMTKNMPNFQEAK